MFIGGHVSIAGGFDKSIDRAMAIGANCLQTFASSPRSLKTNDYPEEIVEKYLQKKAEVKMGPHFFHGVYLVNLATEKKDYLQVSIDSLIFYQQFSDRIHGEGTIFHIGSHKGAGFESVKKQVLGAIVRVLEKTPDGITLYLENAAGHKGVIGADLDELAWLIENVKSKELKSKLAVCFDTQHGFASGLELRTKVGLKQTVEALEASVGLDMIQVIHANDSLPELGSRKDRHANIGEGEIGEKGFELIVNRSKLKNLPFLLEVPGENKSGPRKEDIDSLRKLAKGD